MRTFKQSFARPGIWIFVLVGMAAFFQFFSTYARIYSPAFGITKLLQIGQEFDDRGLVVFRTAPKYVDPSSRWGFDGQFYAELGLDPLLRDSQLQTALDNPTYRSRRILLSWLAALAGWGHPAWVLNVYAALNLVFWTGFAVMMGFLFRPHGWGGLAGFAAMLMTCGIIESMRSSLTDFPGFVLMTWAMMLGGAGGAGVLALSALTREPNIIGIVGLWDYRPPWPAAVRRNLILGLIAGLPVALWFAYVTSRFPSSGEAFAGGNLAWPMQGIMEKLGETWVRVESGGIRWSHWYSEFYSNETLHGLLTIIATLTQCIFLLTHREWHNRIWRVGAVFVPYFLCISIISWESHFNVTRHALPITLAFNLVLAMRPRRGWLVWFLLGNCFVPYGIYLFTIQAQGVSAPPPEYRLVAAQPPTPDVRVRFAQGWSLEEWTRQHTWRWATASHTTLTLTNPTSRPLAASLTFITRSVSPRDMKISVRGVDLWSTRSLHSKLPVETPRFLIPPGETTVEFDSPGAPIRSDNWNDIRLLSFMVQDLQLSLSVPPSGG